MYTHVNTEATNLSSVNVEKPGILFELCMYKEADVHIYANTFPQVHLCIVHMYMYMQILFLKCTCVYVHMYMYMQILFLKCTCV